MPSEPTTTHRIFFAIDTTHELRASVENHIKHLRTNHDADHWRFVESDKLHLTLKFFSAVAESHLPILLQAARRAARNAEPFHLKIEGTGAFGSTKSPRVLWIGIAESGELQRLHTAIEKTCAAAGFPTDVRPFSPHLTIARTRDFRSSGKPSRFAPHETTVATAHRQLGFASTILPVKEFAAIRSELHPSGSRYTMLERFALNSNRQADELRH